MTSQKNHMQVLKGGGGRRNTKCVEYNIVSSAIWNKYLAEYKGVAYRSSNFSLLVIYTTGCLLFSLSTFNNAIA